MRWLLILVLVLAGGCSNEASAGINGPIDVYLIAGQSNAEASGQPDRTPDLPPGIGFEVMGGVVVDLADPTAHPLAGSAWPAFADVAHDRSDVPVAFIETAVGGTPLLPTGASVDWSPDGRLVDESVATGLGALATLVRGGWVPTLHAVLWVQGESDAEATGPIASLGARYEAALHDLHDRYRQDLADPDLPLYIWRTGTRADGDTDGFRTVRDAQEAAAAARDGMEVVYRRAIEFPALGWMRDTYHYTQDGYDDMGAQGARAIIGPRQAD